MTDPALNLDMEIKMMTGNLTINIPLSVIVSSIKDPIHLARALRLLADELDPPWIYGEQQDRTLNNEQESINDVPEN